MMVLTINENSTIADMCASMSSSACWLEANMQTVFAVRNTTTVRATQRSMNSSRVRGETRLAHMVGFFEMEVIPSGRVLASVLPFVGEAVECVASLNMIELKSVETRFLIDKIFDRQDLMDTPFSDGRGEYQKGSGLSNDMCSLCVVLCPRSHAQPGIRYTFKKRI